MSKRRDASFKWVNGPSVIIWLATLGFATLVPPVNAQGASPALASQSPSLIVSYRNQELTIRAHQSRLSDVLHNVQEATGAQIEIPSSANDLITGYFGPAQVRVVLDRLLDGSKFAYAIAGSDDKPDAMRIAVFEAPIDAHEASTSSQTSSGDSASRSPSSGLPESSPGAIVAKGKPKHVSKENPRPAPIIKQDVH